MSAPSSRTGSASASSSRRASRSATSASLTPSSSSANSSPAMRASRPRSATPPRSRSATAAIRRSPATGPSESLTCRSLEVEEDGGQRRPDVAGRLGQRLVEPFPEAQAVRQAGGAVADRVGAQLALQAALLAGVAQREHVAGDVGVGEPVGDPDLRRHGMPEAMAEQQLGAYRARPSVDLVEQAGEPVARRVLGQLGEGAADQLRRRGAEQLRDGVGREGHEPVRVEHDDDVGRVLDKRAEAALGLAQRAALALGARGARAQPLGSARGADEAGQQDDDEHQCERPARGRELPGVTIRGARRRRRSRRGGRPSRRRHGARPRPHRRRWRAARAGPDRGRQGAPEPHRHRGEPLPEGRVPGLADRPYEPVPAGGGLRQRLRGGDPPSRVRQRRVESSVSSRSACCMAVVRLRSCCARTCRNAEAPSHAASTSAAAASSSRARRCRVRRPGSDAAGAADGPAAAVAAAVALRIESTPCGGMGVSRVGPTSPSSAARASAG